MEKFLVHETAIHLIDVFRFLLNEEPSAVYAALRRLNPALKGEDAGMMLFDFPSGARAVFDGTRLHIPGITLHLPAIANEVVRTIVTKCTNRIYCPG